MCCSLAGFGPGLRRSVLRAQKGHPGHLQQQKSLFLIRRQSQTLFDQSERLIVLPPLPVEGSWASSSRARSANSRNSDYGYCAWQLLPNTVIKNSPGLLFACATPLLEEKRNVSAQALVTNLAYPLSPNRTGIWTRFAANNDPVDSFQRVQGVSSITSYVVL